MKTLVATVAVAICCLSAAAQAAEPGKPVTKETIVEHLQAAYDGESNAQARYQVFAVKADADGYARAAQLFRAAAKAEGIHAASHAKVLKSLGATPRADVKRFAPEATLINIKAAVYGETYERDTMYPQFLADAKALQMGDAIRTFNFARQAEAEHAALYAEAAAGLDTWKQAGDGFSVCPVCGKTVATVDFARCAVCRTSAEKFDAVK